MCVCVYWWLLPKSRPTVVEGVDARVNRQRGHLSNEPNRGQIKRVRGSIGSRVCGRGWKGLRFINGLRASLQRQRERAPRAASFVNFDLIKTKYYSIHYSPLCYEAILSSRHYPICQRLSDSFFLFFLPFCDGFKCDIIIVVVISYRTTKPPPHSLLRIL